jgi:hypothetical protein
MSPNQKLKRAVAAAEAGRLDEAERICRQLLAAMPNDSSAINMLAAVHWQRGDASNAERWFRRLLKLSPDDPDILHNVAVVLDALGHYDEAIALFRRAIAIDLQFAHAHTGLAMSLLASGDLANGFREYEWRFFNRHDLSMPRWDGRSSGNVALYSDQGMGDAIQMIRYAPLVAARGATVLVCVGPLLARLFAAAPGVTAVISDAAQLPTDFQICPLLSLPYVFRTTLDTIPAQMPYLPADSAPWLPPLPGLKVGLCWAGRSRTGNINAVATDRRRSMRLADMGPLLDVPGCSFVSLQIGPPADQLQNFPHVLDVSSRLRDWADTAALMMTLDLIITVDTAVAHLAGALGRPVWMLNRFDSCWRWLRGRTDTPWYPTMRIFRQPDFGNWVSVVADVKTELIRVAKIRAPYRHMYLTPPRN